MSQNDLTFLPLRVMHVGAGGRRSFDAVDKRRLVDACLQPGASLSGLALKAGVNANQLRKWVRLHQGSTTQVPDDVASGSSAFVPVVALGAAVPVLASTPAVRPASVRESSRLSSRPAASARLSAQLPNGVKLEFECAADAGLLAAMIAALGAY